jgi:hypothetical protein
VCTKKKNGEFSLRATYPKQHRQFSNPKIGKLALLLSTCLRLFLFCRESVHEKLGRETIKIGKDSLFTLSSWPTGWRGRAPSCLGGLKRARPWFLSQEERAHPKLPRRIEKGSPQVSFTGRRVHVLSCPGGLKSARAWFLSQVGEGAPHVAQED